MSHQLKLLGFFMIVALLPLVDAADDATGEAGAAPAQIVDVNTAEFAMLDALPGVAPHEARAIVDYREAQGPFQSVEDLKRVPGVSSRSVDNVRGELTTRASGEATPAGRWTGRP